MAIIEQITIQDIHVQQSGNINVHQQVDFVRDDLAVGDPDYHRGTTGRNAYITKDDYATADGVLGTRADDFATAAQWSPRPV